MRHFFLIVSCLAVPAFAQQSLPELEPLPEPPPLPADFNEDESGVAVTIRHRGEDKIEEYRVRGRLYMMKVTPAHGTPYYLIDKEGTGQMVRDDTAPSLSVPMWVLKNW